IGHKLYDFAFRAYEISLKIKSVDMKDRNELNKEYATYLISNSIFDGEDIYKFLEMGAAGVQMGTRFVATNECDADIKFKEQFVKCHKEDIGIIKSPVGLPGRAIINKFLTDVTSGMKKPFNCPWKCLKTCKMQQSLYCIADALMKAKIGNLTNGFSFAGVNAYRIEKVVSVKELIDSLRYEFEVAVLKLQGKKMALMTD
ncbi:MAG: nitronate monooxygenase, partial [Candidatus Cloacimonetes bacterium]|nr:nitronate monooxygenase [Candidatus Cloacimonadota bacterium]